jgi:hypothetical protein
VTMMSRRQAGLIPRHPHEGRFRRSSVPVHPAHAAPLHRPPRRRLIGTGVNPLVSRAR